jgi:sulfite oxidase
MPITSAICKVTQNEPEGSVVLKGYAYSGGGRGISSVEVTNNNGDDWVQAKFHSPLEYVPSKNWAWSLWEVEVEASDKVCVRAHDEAYNT